MAEEKVAFSKGRSWTKFKKHNLAVLALIGLLTFYLCAVFANFLAPYSLDEEDRSTSYQPPSSIHWLDEGQWNPYIYNYTYQFDSFYNRIRVEDTSKKYHLKLFNKKKIWDSRQQKLVDDNYSFLGLFKTNLRLFGVEFPGRFYFFGADEKGRDVFSRLLFGSRVSLSIGLLGSFIVFILGMMMGAIAGYYGGRTDNIIMRICEIFMMAPSFYLLLALRAALPVNLSSIQVFFGITIILAFIGWAGLARVIRGMVLAEARKEYVLAAKALGVNSFFIMVKHILPNTFSYAIISLTIGIPSYILGESALSLLGLGIMDPDASWGNMLSEAMAISEIQFHPWILIPGFFIFLAVMMFNLLGDGLRDALDPKT
ncbi:MAG: ABC transporter permease [Deltaproteobacteria bacterium]|nr:ABC transporter permease [Deltaproteobacteria bacterium]